jgi:phosphoserine phosphatase
MNGLVVYVDVDDTFVRSAGTKRIPMRRTLEHVRALKQSGATLYCWSAGGAEYARKSAQEFGLGDCFEAYLPKPNVMIDDQSVAEWSLCLEIHPAELTNDVDYWGKIRSR